MVSIKQASVKQLANKIKGYGDHPRFALFLGAGASRQSDIITASEMIQIFKERIIDECCPNPIKADKQKEEWLGEQDWYKKDGSEYSKLFEEYEPKEIGRQRYIESIVEGRDPSFGYVVLANLMASKLINTVITTNFDDLVYSACTSYTGIRPIVYAYGVLASEMRITAQRPKILKLHGDFLYSTLKNTDAELAAQDPNMARQVLQVLNEYGLVVIGYSGGDRSVMEILNKISEKNDLYWCIRRGDEPDDAVKKLLIAKAGFLVEIEGFDEMMNDIRHIVGFDVGKMFGSIQERQDQMIEKLKDFAPSYSIDILSEVVEALRHQAEQANLEQAQIKKFQALDYFTRALKAEEAGQRDAAKKLYLTVLELDPTDAKVYNNLANIIGKDDPASAEAEAAYRKTIKIAPTLSQPYNNLVILLRLNGKNNEAIAIAKKYLEAFPQSPLAILHLAGIYKKLGREQSVTPYLSKARDLVKPDDFYNLACIESISGNTDNAIEYLQRAAKNKSFNRRWAREDPDLEWIRSDPRFATSLAGDGV